MSIDMRVEVDSAGVMCVMAGGAVILLVVRLLEIFLSG